MFKVFELSKQKLKERKLLSHEKQFHIMVFNEKICKIKTFDA